MRFVGFDQVRQVFDGKRVAIVGSGPGCLDNEPGFVDSHDVVVRVNNHKVGHRPGYRTDVHYSFYGNSIRVSAEELRRQGVMLCMCKCPDAKAIESKWHEDRGKLAGIDFRYIYELRRDWWFCDTYVPSVDEFNFTRNILNGHIPTTGYTAILDVFACSPKSIYLTGFDFFASGVHNVDEPWKPGNPEDPIGHRPDLEARSVKGLIADHGGISVDARLAARLEQA